MKILFKQIINFFYKHRQINYFIICLCISLFLWLFITYSKEYEQNLSIIVNFVDNTNQVTYYTNDSVLTLSVKTNGFDFLAKNYTSKKNKLIIDVNKLDASPSSNKIVLPTSRLKNQIVNELGYRSEYVRISPTTINLSRQELYYKKVKVINKAIFNFVKPYEAYSPAQVLIDEVIIEGNKQQLQQIDTIFTKSITYNNIKKGGIFLVDLDLNLPDGVICRLKSIPIKIVAEKYTENTVMLPVKVIRYDDYRNVRLLPKEVKVRYRVAIKDYAKVNEKNFKAIVSCDNKDLENNSKLKIKLENIPNFIKIVNIYPEKVDYILYK